MIHEFGPEHRKMSLIQSYQKYIISLKHYKHFLNSFKQV